MSDLTKSIFPMDLKLRIEADGRVSAMPLGATESVRLGAEASRTAARTASIEAPFDDNYAGRKGYDAGFLGHRVVVNLPKIGPALMTEVAKLIKKVGNNDHVLHYHNYSLVMHAERRLALYSAANLDFANRFQMSRPTDVWRRDPRILAKYQLEDWYYKSNNFDRGHLTRREDLEYGATRKGALQSAADTCHWTNCTPQHARFNQNKEIWQGIERYILESRILEDDIKAQVITGPVLDEGDPDYKEIQYPVSYWKVVAALDEHNKLFATAYIASQADVIAQYGIEAAPFGAFMTFQTTVSEIERLTGLSFTYNGNQPLTERDPLTMRPARRRRASGTHEAMSAALPPNYWPINALEDIRI